jgi:Mg-chelatase subunit ChlD
MMTETATPTAAPVSATDAASLVKTTAAIDQLKKSLAKNSLDDLVKARSRRSLLLVDTSSSMGQVVYRLGVRRIDALRNVVDDIRESHPVPVAAFSGSNVRVVDTVPEPCGNTPMCRAIDFATREGANHIVLVTDGQPTDGIPYAAARAFGGPIDTFYIGNGNDEGARLCQELSRMTGGTCNVTDLGEPKRLSAKIAGRLGE